MKQIQSITVQQQTDEIQGSVPQTAVAGEDTTNTAVAQQQDKRKRRHKKRAKKRKKPECSIQPILEPLKFL